MPFPGLSIGAGSTSLIDATFAIYCVDPAISIPQIETLQSQYGETVITIPELGGAQAILDPESRDRIFHRIRQYSGAFRMVQLAFMNHTNCLAKGLRGINFQCPKEEEAFHREEMAKAKAIAQGMFPGVPVEEKFFCKTTKVLLW